MTMVITNIFKIAFDMTKSCLNMDLSPMTYTIYTASHSLKSCDSGLSIHSDLLFHIFEVHLENYIHQYTGLKT